MGRIGIAWVVGALLVVAGVLRTWQPAAAELDDAAFADPLAWLSASGRYALVTGPITCTVGDTYDLQLKVTQGDAGVQAAGVTGDQCAGDVQRWSVKAEVGADSPALAPGAAQFCATATTWRSDAMTDQRQWCGELNLRRPGANP